MHRTMRKPAPIIRLQTEMLACQDLGLADHPRACLDVFPVTAQPGELLAVTDLPFLPGRGDTIDTVVAVPGGVLIDASGTAASST